MDRTLKDFLNLHKGETAWVFGKGPSLSKFDFSTAGPLRYAINDVVQAVPNCVYCSAADSVLPWEDLYKPEHILIQPDRVAGTDYQEANPNCEVVLFPEHWGDDSVLWTREELAEHGLATKHGTLGYVAQVLHVMGVKKIIAVGVDGGRNHAEGYEWRTRILNGQHIWYDQIRDQFILFCALSGIDLEFSDIGKRFLVNGMQRVKIIRGTTVANRTHYAGEIVDVLPSEAAVLFEVKKAIPWEETFVEVEDANPAVEVTSALPPMERISTGRFCVERGVIQRKVIRRRTAT